jgi:hypothetical protein
MKRTIGVIASGTLFGLCVTFTSAPAASALPPNPIQPWGEKVSYFARSLPPNPVKGSFISAFARLHGDDPPIIIIDE